MANQQNFMDKELNQAIRIRSKLRNKYLKSKSEINKHRHNKKRKYCFKLLRLEKEKYYESLDVNKITDRLQISDKLQNDSFKKRVKNQKLGILLMNF